MVAAPVHAQTWPRMKESKEVPRKGAKDCGSRIADSKTPTSKSEIGSRLGERSGRKEASRKGAKMRGNQIEKMLGVLGVLAREDGREEISRKDAKARR